jgi:hypothetical protein
MLKEPFSSYDVGLDSSRRFERLNVQRFQHVSTLKLKGNHMWLSCFTSYRMAVAHPTITVALHRGYLMYLQLINLPTRRVPWHQGLRIKHQLKWQSNSAVFPLQNVICMEQIYSKCPLAGNLRNRSWFSLKVRSALNIQWSDSFAGHTCWKD